MNLIAQWIEEALEEVIELTEVVNPEADARIEFEDDTMKLALRGMKFAKSPAEREMHRKAYMYASQRKQSLLTNYGSMS